MKHYYAVRPTSMPQHIRIEKADTPQEAIKLAFGRGLNKGAWQWKDLGTRITVIHSDKQRLALLNDPNNWNTLE